MPKQWRIHPHDAERIGALAASAKIPAVVAQLLICRGLTDAQRATEFLDIKLSNLRDPALLPGATDAAERITRAIVAKERITVYGDYDVDGMTGAALLGQCLKLLGADVGYYVPHRIDEGYGLHDDALTQLAAQGTKLVVTVDCGICSVAETATARGLGMDIVISDHHLPGDTLPAASAIVHPGLPGGGYPFAGLSGSGVALKLAWALCQQASGAIKVSERMKDFLLSAVGLAALGTVADVVPLVDENRVLVQFGLKSLKERPTLGIATLLGVAGLDKKRALSTEDLGFEIAPRLNAAGRLGQALLGVELLTTTVPARATALAEYISELNNSRKSLERSIYLAANKQAQEQLDAGHDTALVLAGHGWHAGVIGIVAGRIAEKYHRPVVMIALDEMGVRPGVGSARSVPGFDLHQALMQCKDQLVSCGGHAAAAGLRIEESHLDAFRDEFGAAVGALRDKADTTAEVLIDAEVSLSALTYDTMQHIERLAPFGAGNRRPLFCTTGVTLDAPPERIGGGGRHLTLKLSQGGVSLRAVAFGGGDWIDDLTTDCGPLDVAFRPVFNDFAGRRRIELQVTDWRVSQLASLA